MASNHRVVFEGVKAALDGLVTSGKAAKVETVLRTHEELRDSEFPWIGVFPTTASEEFGASIGPSGKLADARFVAVGLVRSTDPVTSEFDLKEAIEEAIDSDPAVGTSIEPSPHVEVVSATFMNTSESATADGNVRIGFVEIEIRARFRHARENA